jgi:hypothetical protein
VCSTFGLDTNAVVNCISKTLLATKTFLGRLHGYVLQQKLDLVQFTSGVAALAGAGPAEIMRS